MSTAGQVVGGIVGAVVGFLAGPSGSFAGMAYSAQIGMMAGEFIAPPPDSPSESQAGEGE